MPDHLSITNLLSLLKVEQRTNQQRNILKLCHEAEKLRQRRHIKDALDVAEYAAQLAQKAFDFKLQGVTLLYASQARISSHLPGEDQRAIFDCERAIRLFNLDPYNCAIARIIRAQMELQTDKVDKQHAALAHFLKASHELKKLAEDAREHHDVEQTERYVSLHHDVEVAVEELSDSLTRVRSSFTPRPPFSQPGISLQSTKSTFSTLPSQDTSSPIKLPIPAELTWPTRESMELEFTPMADGITPDCVEVGRMTIKGRTYVPSNLPPNSSLQLQTGKAYFTLPLVGNSDQMVLVRRQDRPDHDKQYVVVADESNHQAWVDDCESSVPYTHVHVIGINREWDIKDEIPFHIIGIVEAVLILIA